MKCRSLWLWVLFFLCGCSVAPSKNYQPMSDSSHLKNLVVMQHWDIKIKQKEFHLQMVAQAIEGGWQWIVLNDFGQRQVTISSKNGVLKIQEFQPSQITGYIDQLVMVWQLIFWPPDLIQLSNQSQWLCKLEPDRRVIYFNGQPYASISFAGNDISDMKVEYQSIDMQVSLSSYPLM